MDIQYQHPELIIGLMALPFLGLLFWYVLRWKKNVTTKIGDEKLVKELSANHSPSKYIIKFGLGVLALAAIRCTARELPLHSSSLSGPASLPHC